MTTATSFYIPRIKTLALIINALLLCFWVNTPALTQKAYNFRGNAAALGNTDCYRITQAQNGQLGAVWYKDKIRLDKSFDLEFSMNFGSKDDDGADGMVFVIQSAGNNVIGTFGQGIGYANFSPSLGIEFDTWQNDDENDPAFDHIAVVKNGIVNHRFSLTSPVQAMSGMPNIEDGKDHNIRISWDAKRGFLELYFDCQKRIGLTINISKDIFGGQKEAWWGFTGATGGSNNLQTVCLRKDIVAKDTFQICKGESVELVARNSADNRYTWSPRALLSDPDSRSPLAKPDKSQLFLVNYNDFCNEKTLDSIYVEVTPTPSFSLGPDLNPCDTAKKVRLLPQISPKINDVIFNWSNKATTEGIDVTESGDYKLDIDAKGCKLSDSLTVTFRPTPEVPKVEEPYFCVGDAPALLDPKKNEANWRFLWTPTLQTTPTVLATAAGVYKVKITNVFNCAVERSFKVRDDCPPAVFIPDVFTPNTDGQNDIFEIKSADALITELTVYNRWGQVVFQSDDLKRGWDGTINGSAAPNGAYAWQFRYQYRRANNPLGYEKRGVVSLVR